MNKKDPRPAMPELPEEILGIIRGEVESGLAQFRAGNFEGRLKAGLREAAARARRSNPPALLRWAPACGIALAVVFIGIAVLWFSRGPQDKPANLTASLEKLPGFQSLNKVTLDQHLKAGPSSQAESPLLRPLAAAVAVAASATPVVPAPPRLTPYYTLEQKIEILIKEQPIERALVLIKSKSGEV